MKIRNGFVSNSSSSSFVIERKFVTNEQSEKIINHIEYGKEHGIGGYFDDPWAIDVSDDYVHGWCGMDNFNMYQFFDYIGIDNNEVRWGD